MDELRGVKQSASGQRAVIANLHAEIEDLKDDPGRVSDVKAKLQRLDTAAAKLEDLRDALLRLIPETETESELQVFQEPEEQIDQCRKWGIELEKLAKEADRPPGQGSMFSFGKRTLNKFHGSSTDDYIRFRTEFLSLASQYDNSKYVTDVERYNTLRDHLTGTAQSVIDGLRSKDDCYRTAWRILDQIYIKPIQTTVNIFAPIFDCKKASGPNNGYNWQELSRVHATYFTACKSMENRGFDVEENHGFLMTKARRDFPARLVCDFDDLNSKNITATNRCGTTTTVMQFLDFALTRLNTQLSTERPGESDAKKSPNQKPQGGQGSASKTHATSTVANTGNGQGKCGMCDRTGHAPIKCDKWKQLDRTRLNKLLKEKNLCIICGESHYARDCTKGACQKCKKKHNTKLCPQNNPNKAGAKGGSGSSRPQGGRGNKPGYKKSHAVQQVQAPAPAAPQSQPTQQGQQTTAVAVPTQVNTVAVVPQPGTQPAAMPAGIFVPYTPRQVNTTVQPTAAPALVQACHGQERQVILDTLKCKIVFTRGKKEISKVIRVFLDSGSEINLVRRKVARDAEGAKTTAHLVVTTGASLISKERLVSFRLRSLDGTYTTPSFVATTLEKITDPLRPVDYDPKQVEHLQDIRFTEEYPTGPLPVDLLVGNEIVSELFTGQIRKSEGYSACAKETKLGWILSGSF